MKIANEILMYFRTSKKTNAEVFLGDTIGKDKDDNVVTLEEVLENDERSVEDEVDLKMKIKILYERMKDSLKERERSILEKRYGLDGHKPKTQIEIAKQMGISRSYVSRIETKAIGKLSEEFKKDQKDKLAKRQEDKIKKEKRRKRKGKRENRSRKKKSKNKSSYK